MKNVRGIFMFSCDLLRLFQCDLFTLVQKLAHLFCSKRKCLKSRIMINDTQFDAILTLWHKTEIHTSPLVESA